MPKTHSDWPINLTMRISIAQRDYLNDVASMHKCSPSDFLRGLIENSRVDAAISTIDRVMEDIDE